MSENPKQNFIDSPLAIDDILFKHLHGFGLIFIKESPTELVMIISSTPQYSFSVDVHYEDFVTLQVFGTSPPLEALVAAADTIGISPEQWGFEPSGTLTTVLNIRSPRSLVTDHSSIRIISYPKEMPIYHFFAIPFFSPNSSNALHFPKLTLPKAPQAQNSNAPKE